MPHFFLVQPKWTKSLFFLFLKSHSLVERPHNEKADNHPLIPTLTSTLFGS